VENATDNYDDEDKIIDNEENIRNLIEQQELQTAFSTP